MIISNQRIRIGIDASQMGTLNDVLTGASPQFWNGVDLQFELALFYGAALAAVSNLTSITVEVKQGDPRTGLPLMSKTIASGALNQSLTPSAWQGGAVADCHALVVFTNSETNLNLNDDDVTFWLVISGLTSDTPAHTIVYGAANITVVEGGEGVEPPASVVTPLYFTAAQSDARYARTVDLTTINTHLSTLDTEMTAVTTTANAALPKAGGTLSGALTITGLSGVLKATAGLIAGSATTSDLTEGSNLYWTQARFNTALAAVAGAASGVCPLDSSSLIPAAFLPSITVHNTFVVVSQAAMLALAAHMGDVAIRTDINQSFILTNNVPTVLGNWTQLLTPASSVTSVNGLSGAVVLTTTNIAEGTNLYYTTVRAKADALAAALTGFSNATGGNVTAGDSILVALGRHENRMVLNDAKLTGSDRVKIDGSIAMTGALTFSGTGHAGIRLNNLADTDRALLTPATGMIIYDTTFSQVMIYNGAWQAVSGAGTSWFNGTGAPASTLGSNGAYYLDNATGNVYLKSAGSWAVIYSPSTVLLSGNIFATTYNGTGTAPTIAVQSHAGSGATADLSTDTNATSAAFRVKLVTGTGGSAGALFTVVFPAAYSYKPKITWSADAGDYLPDLYVDYTTITTAGFTFSTLATIASGNTFHLDFHVVG